MTRTKLFDTSIFGLRGPASGGRRSVSGAAFALVLAASAGLTACTTMGVGTGQAAGGDVNATFAWTSQGATDGVMTANLSTGESYQGRFFQVTQQSTVDNLAPLWVGWGGRGRWGGWNSWGPDSSVVTKYTGQVLANLQGPKGYIRCHFVLARPAEGMAGGGIGTCQLPSGTIIDAEFPKG